LNPGRGKCRSRHNSLLRPSPPRRIPFLKSNLTAVKKFEVWTDHENLKYFKELHKLNG